MDPQYLLLLLEKYSTGACTPAELELLDAWYTALGKERPDQLLDPDSEAAMLLTQQKLQELRARLTAVPAGAPLRPVRNPLWRRMGRWAAVVAGIALVSGMTWYSWQQRRQQVALQATPQTVDKLAYSRHITLPDSSTVVLHAGSRLEYPAAFSGAERVVTLSGEAYFDIREDPAHRFVINTGRVKTTVLGTAFNIKAYPGSNEITVSVTKGKVKVEDGQQVLAVLTPDQQMVYNTLAATLAQKPVNALEQVNWAREDMVFESVPFEQITTAISKRYEVDIRFDNPALAQCPVRASFSGTESLEEVLTVLCTVRNATYTLLPDGDVMIHGKGCSN
ncbi:FecR domain-containing protein [Chitinophaga japonensis]|uniref:FecR family protein n=1 Tax=Chitinophaga japonensis TaxID=104662 RepID=A0A562SMH5_CHIJA|nr:FecR domain-containing protein [Chitinophaga japonensis]TWI82505.1 FecR family protein [Chitinophaga japonensis]